MKLSDLLTFGTYAGEPIVWKAIAEENGRFLLLSQKVLEYRPFHNDPVPKELYGKDYMETNWGTCDLRRWLNGTFFQQAFSEEEQRHIPESDVLYPTFYKTLHSRFPGEDTCRDRVFLLTQGQAKIYLSEEDRIARLTDHARTQAGNGNVSPLRQYGAWWLRTTLGQGFDGSCMYVYNFVGKQSTGAILASGGAGFTTRDIGVRPAIWYQP